MYYVKAEIAEGVTIRAEITDENVFNQCPKCGAEVAVDLAEIVTDNGPDLFGTAIYCDECGKAARSERETEEHRHKASTAEREAEYFDDLTAAMKAIVRVWDADGVTPKEKIFRLQMAFPEFLPKLPPEAFADEEN